jgi:hypothetical protein
VAGTATATGAPAGTLNIPIYFQETDTGNQTVFGNGTVKGLSQYGVLIYQTSSGGTSTINS